MEPLIIASASALLMSLTLVFYLLHSQRELKRQHQQLSSEIRDLRSSLDTVMTCSVGMGRRIGDFQTRLKRISQQQMVQQMREQPGADGIEHALDLMERGASEDELIDRCGLNQGEARLMNRLRPLH